jgi:NAD kinase
MIKKLEDLIVGDIAHRPNKERIVEKVNEIIEFLNKQPNTNETPVKKEIEITLLNGYTVQIFQHEGKAIVNLVSDGGYGISVTALSETEVKTLKEVVKGF